MSSVNFNPPALGMVTDDPRYNERNGLGIIAAIQANIWMAQSAPPPNTFGTNNDFCFVPSGTEAGHTLLYHKEAGAWVATAV